MALGNYYSAVRKWEDIVMILMDFPGGGGFLDSDGQGIQIYCYPYPFINVSVMTQCGYCDEFSCLQCPLAVDKHCSGKGTTFGKITEKLYYKDFGPETLRLAKRMLRAVKKHKDAFKF